ncbi:tetraacyldisaccharide 4'-kinase [Glaciecola sp. 1036]|uniref:tetraacyldisaccharide 4'-kinase n=1 Tax=Alteromonadaceae TaxID=72275 RepID=UPI003D0230EC
MDLQKALYTKPGILWFLAPLSIIFWILQWIRRSLYNLGILSIYKSRLPVIVVGNISVGGNGKTPVVIALVEYLSKKGYQPAVLSRGYGGQLDKHPYQVNHKVDAKLVGDEPWLIYKRFGIPVVIDPERARGAKYIEDFTNADIIICDDGMQHYALARDIEICVMDDRGLGNGYLLPMGPLREPMERLNSVDLIVFNGKRLNEMTFLHQIAPDIVQMSLVPDKWINLQDGRSQNVHHVRTLFMSDLPIKAIAGIGNPQRFFSTLYELSVTPDEEQSFPDHYNYQEADLAFDGILLMTEKDAVKCTEFNLVNAWYLIINAQLSDAFYQYIDAKLLNLKRD